MKNLNKIKKYPGFTLSEMLLVIAIIIVLSAMTYSTFGNLRNTVRLNEYMLNLEQDIRAMQRASMLLQRNPYENWVYGIGIDFSSVEDDGYYRFFKWCSNLSDYGDITTRSNIPGFDPRDTAGGLSETNGFLPLDVGVDLEKGLCDTNNQTLRILRGFEDPMTPPLGDINIEGDVQYVLFESISGRAFLYNSLGHLVNYEPISGELLDTGTVNFTLSIKPFGAKERKISIMNLSGKIDTHIQRYGK